VSKLNKTQKKERRGKVAKLFLTGYDREEIATKMGMTLNEVSSDLKMVKRQLEPKTIRETEYFRNKIRLQIDLGRVKASEIMTGHQDNPSVVLSAMRIDKEYLKLLAEVDGIISEKMPTTAPKEAAALLKEIAKLEIKVKSVPGEDGGNGRGDVEETVDAKPGS